MKQSYDQTISFDHLSGMYIFSISGKNVKVNKDEKIIFSMLFTKKFIGFSLKIIDFSPIERKTPSKCAPHKHE